MADKGNRVLNIAAETIKGLGSLNKDNRQQDHSV